jgi:pSer/pThr/pTyr-binding forkhead associated (FHA) protein
MTKLNILIENDGNSYSLKAGKEYILGSDADCTPPLPYNNVDNRHLKFTFNSTDNIWYVTDLNSKFGTVINGRSIANFACPIDRETRISIGNTVFIKATPEAIVQNITVPLPQQIAPPPPNRVSYPYSNPNSYSSNLDSSRTPISTDIRTLKINKLTWNEYVTEQVSKQRNLLARIGTDFHLTTGLRNAPWISANEFHSSGFGFDGYVVPNFLQKGSVEEVRFSIISSVANNVAELMIYENTDCFISELTDEHLTNSAKESILQQLFSVRFFPIRRGGKGKPDFREFLVISYNQIRTYLIVEGYGTDLFVSWITRYEPNLASGLAYWLVTAIALFVLLLASKNLVIATVPLCLWSIVYLLLPQIIKRLKILPKKANAYLFLCIFITQYFASLAFTLSKVQNSSEDFIVSIGISIGSLVILLFSFVAGIILTACYVAAVVGAIWAVEQVSANTNTLSRK